MISNCTCKHKFQDRKYGAGRRVFNVSSVIVTGDVPGHCSVCEKEHSVHLERK